MQSLSVAFQPGFVTKNPGQIEKPAKIQLGGLDLGTPDIY